ncbi:winged helix-turn-helix transcriptional regulator [Streptomyces sp. NPDC006527]|jgi:DNA-binding HxlR family transcriptional regulator|uniref:winged helix-turn-helix transcriptional regulator n=1 Tax=Streptomyces sp. NPDC006527 TaxID=3364749 RepID=UPI0036BC564F
MTKRIASAADSGQRCSIGRALEVVGDRWSLLILREAVQGVTRFSEFRERLHVASDVLTQRLGVLTDAGVLEKHPYREDGSRTRMAYRLTPAGRDLVVVIGALQQWGDLHRPHPDGPLVHRASRATGRPLRVAFIDDEGNEAPLEDVHLAARFDAPKGSDV